MMVAITDDRRCGPVEAADETACGDEDLTVTSLATSLAKDAYIGAAYSQP
jgi:hypothetical protein